MGGATEAVAPGVKFLGGTKFQKTGGRVSGSANGPRGSGAQDLPYPGSWQPRYATEVLVM